MKSIKTLSLFGLLIITLFTSCSKDCNPSDPSGNKDALSQKLEQSLTEFELIDLDLSTLNAELKNNNNEKALVLVPGKYEFKLQSLKAGDPVEILDEETNTTSYLDLTNTSFDNLNLGDENGFASFTFINNTLSGQFEKDGKTYLVSPASQFVEDAPSTSYVIYIDESVNSTDAQSPLETDAIMDEEATDEEYVYDIDVEGSQDMNSPMASNSVKTLKVNLFTELEFRRTFKWNKPKCEAYMIKTLNTANAKYRKAKMPVILKVGKIFHPKKHEILNEKDIIKLNDVTFTNYLKKNPKNKGAANLLFTDQTNYNARATWYSVCNSKKIACATIKYNTKEAQRDNFTAHEIAHMLGCKHKIVENYGVNVLNGRVPKVVAYFIPATRTEMIKWVKNHNKCM